jgi:hypothetical protein
MDFGNQGYYDVKEYVGALSPQDQDKVASRMKEGSLDYGISDEMAGKMEVRVHGKMRTLQWVAENKPARLEMLLDTMKPGSVLFEAVTIIYNKNLDKIIPAVEKENSRIRDAGIQGLKNWAERGRVDRPRTRLRMYLKPGALGEKPRMYLTGDAIRYWGIKGKPRVYLN